jgi:hypothetical protein
MYIYIPLVDSITVYRYHFMIYIHIYIHIPIIYIYRSIQQGSILHLLHQPPEVPPGGSCIVRCRDPFVGGASLATCVENNIDPNQDPSEDPSYLRDLDDMMVLWMKIYT